MAETIQDFLISVKYSVDAASQSNFIEALKRVAGSTAGVALEIAGLTGSILKLTESLAETGEKLYFMSQRLDASVDGIQAVTFALSNLGESSEQAQSNLERFGVWTSSMGPAATGWLRTMGVTATDTAERMRQVAEYFRTHAAAPGSLEYAINLRKASMMGLDEQTLIAMQSGKFAQYDQRSGYLQQLVWGVGTPEQLKAKQDNWTTLSNKVMVQFREIGLIFTTLAQTFGADLFEKMLPQLQALNQHLQDALPTISKLLAGAATAMGAFVQGVSSALEVFPKLPPLVKDMIIGLTAWQPALALLRSPLAWFVGTLVMLIALLDDYAHYKRDLETGKKTHLLDWGKIENSALFKIGKEFSDWYTSLNSVQKILVDIAAGLVLIGGRAAAIAAAGGLKRLLVGGAAEAEIGGLLAALGITGVGIVAGGVAAAGVGIVESHVKEQMNQEAAKMGFEKKPGSVTFWHPEGSWINYFTGKEMTDDEMRGALGAVGPPGERQFNPIHGIFPHAPEGAHPGGPDEATTGPQSSSATDSNRQVAGPGAPGVGAWQESPGTRGDVAAMMRGIDQARGGGGDAPSDSPSDIGLNQDEWDAFRQRLGMRESTGRYGLMGGSSGKYAGKYQFGPAALSDTAQLLHERTPTAQEFLRDPEMQERFFRAYTLNHHRQLMNDPAYRRLSPAQRAGYLAEAHLIGPGGALRELHGQYAGADAFNTSGHSYNVLGQQAVLGANRAATAASNRNTTVNSNVVINIAPGPTAHATAVAVQDRLNENAARTARTALTP